MTKERTHAEILADIARQVVQQHRAQDAEHLEEGTDPAWVRLIDPSWDYVLPERWQG
jgi:hypothetical protein